MSPQNPSSAVRTSRSIYCTWNPPPQEDQNGVIIEYRINVTEVITGRIFVVTSTTTSVEITSLHPDYVYTWVVTAVTVGVGPYTSTSTIRTPEDGEILRVYYSFLVFGAVFYRLLPDYQLTIPVRPSTYIKLNNISN